MTYSFLLRSLGALALGSLSFSTLHSATIASSFASQSRLSTGKWVKIAVDRSGMQSLSFDTLKKWGFSNPQAVRVYGYSGVEHNPRLPQAAPDDLPQVPAFTSNGKLIFYGEGPQRVYVSADMGDIPDDEEINLEEIEPVYNTYFYTNPYSNTTYYFLSDSGDNELLPSLAREGDGSGNQITTCMSVHRQLCEEYSNLSGGTYLYSRPLSPGEKRDFTFPMPAYASGASISYQFAALSQTAQTTGDLILPSTVTPVQSTDNTRPVIERCGEYFKFNLTSPGRQLFEPNAGSLTHTFSLQAPDEPMDLVCAYQATLTYWRHTSLGSDAQFTMLLPQPGENQKLILTDVPQDVMVWDVTLPLHPCNLQLSTGNGFADANLPNSSNRTLVAFSPSRDLIEPAYAGVIEPQSLHSLATPRMVIISTDACMEQARRLADIHKNSFQKMETAVVRQSDIFNEFSSGACAAEGVRKFLQMLELRNPGKLKYVTLMGAGNFDNRGIIKGYEGREYFVNYETDSLSYARNETMAYASDQYFTLFNPAYEVGESQKLPVDVVKSPVNFTTSIGRIPALTAQEAKDYVDKVELYLNHPEQVAGDYTTVLCVGDFADKNKHVTNGVERDADIIKSFFPGANFHKTYQELQESYSLNAIPEMTKSFSQAVTIPAGYITFSGHATHSILGKRIFLTEAQEKHLSYGSMPIVFVGACNPLGIDNPKGSILGQMVLHPKQGPIATIGAHRTAFMTPNQAFEHLMAQHLFSALPGHDCLGDAYLKAFNDMMEKTLSNRINTMCYAIAGDPAIPLYIPAYSMEITESADGTNGDNFVLQPGSTNTLKGRVTDGDGKIAPINGLVEISLYDQPYSVALKEMYPDDVGYSTDVFLDQNCIATATGSVKDGSFEISLTLPDITVPDPSRGIYRLSLRARTLPKEGEAPVSACGLASVVLDTKNAGSRPSSDYKAPVIDYLYVNSPDINGSAIPGTDVTVYASVSDTESGLATKAFGALPRLSLDGNILPEAAQQFVAVEPGIHALRLPLGTVSDGRHTLTLAVSDNAGNTTQRSLEFMVDSELGKANLTTDLNIAREKITFTLTHDLPSEGLLTELIITDSTGKTRLNKKDLSYPWTLQVNWLPDGHYTARTLLRTPQGFVASPATSFTVFKK